MMIIQVDIVNAKNVEIALIDAWKDLQGKVNSSKWQIVEIDLGPSSLQIYNDKIQLEGYIKFAEVPFRGFN